MTFSENLRYQLGISWQLEVYSIRLQFAKDGRSGHFRIIDTIVCPITEFKRTVGLAIKRRPSGIRRHC